MGRRLLALAAVAFVLVVGGCAPSSSPASPSAAPTGIGGLPPLPAGYRTLYVIETDYVYKDNTTVSGSLFRLFADVRAPGAPVGSIVVYPSAADAAPDVVALKDAFDVMTAPANAAGATVTQRTVNGVTVVVFTGAQDGLGAFRAYWWFGGGTRWVEAKLDPATAEMVLADIVR